MELRCPIGFIVFFKIEDFFCILKMVSLSSSTYKISVFFLNKILQLLKTEVVLPKKGNNMLD